MIVREKHKILNLCCCIKRLNGGDYFKFYSKGTSIRGFTLVQIFPRNILKVNGLRRGLRLSTVYHRGTSHEVGPCHQKIEWGRLLQILFEGDSNSWIDASSNFSQELISHEEASAFLPYKTSHEVGPCHQFQKADDGKGSPVCFS